MIAADFVKCVGAVAIDSQMRWMNLRLWAGAINEVLASQKVNGTMKIFYTLKGAGILGSTRNIRTNDDAGDNIERYVVRLVVQDASVQFVDIIGLSVLLLASIRAVGIWKRRNWSDLYAGWIFEGFTHL